MEGPPGRTQEMVWGKCPHCNGSGNVRDSSGKAVQCGRCHGKGQIQTR
jgi:DnaJ-class molecular chaperone